MERPTTKFNWFLPIDGDGSHIGTLEAERPPTFQYLKSVVESAEQGGFHSLLVPTRFVNGLFEENAPLMEMDARNKTPILVKTNNKLKL